MREIRCYTGSCTYNGAFGGCGRFVCTKNSSMRGNCSIQTDDPKDDTLDTLLVRLLGIEGEIHNLSDPDVRDAILKLLDVVTKTLEYIKEKDNEN